MGQIWATTGQRTPFPDRSRAIEVARCIPKAATSWKEPWTDVFLNGLTSLSSHLASFIILEWCKGAINLNRDKWKWHREVCTRPESTSGKGEQGDCQALAHLSAQITTRVSMVCCWPQTWTFGYVSCKNKEPCFHHWGRRCHRLSWTSRKVRPHSANSKDLTKSRVESLSVKIIDVNFF